MPHTEEEIAAQEITEIQAVFEDLIAKLTPRLQGEDEVNIRKAFHLALDAHKFQRRKSGEAYIFHPLEVARICFEEIGLGPTAVICAILHDVVEDTPINLESIYEMFGPKVTRIVDGLTKLDGLYNRGNENAENLKKVLSSMVEDVRVALIKMADRLHNLRTIGSMPAHKQLKIAAETMYIYAPLAHRLGLYNIKTEFEDTCMKITDGEKYRELRLKIANTEEERKKYINRFIKPIEEGLDKLGFKYRIHGRPKAISSIYNKIQNKNVDFEQIYDLFAVRIIVDSPPEYDKTMCWQIYSVITDHYTPIPERLKDYITTPKSNGYKSLHTTVIGPDGKFVEVQIRSERMDEIAEKGFAAHWKYKGVTGNDNMYEKWLDNVRSILETNNDDAIDFLNDFKSNLFKEEVYVFTPKGDMRILPKGATALDFAFDIHSDVGASASSIKINNKLVPMGYVLQNGDQVIINTSKNQSPKEDWLKLVITGKARSKIRSALNEKRRQLAEIGKESLMRKLRNLKVDFEENMDVLVGYFNFKTRQELYLAIAEEEIKTSDFSKLFTVENGVLSSIKQEGTKPVKSKSITPSPSEPSNMGQYIKINDEPASSFQYELSQCCNPVPGDEIFAFLSSSSGLKIHRRNCKNASNLFTNYDYRIMSAEWTDKKDREYEVELRIIGIDSGIGVIQMLSNELSNNLGINIRSFSIEGHEGVYEGKLKIIIKDRNQLHLVMQKLKSLDGISTVERLSMI
jgi:GTP pyrophosphokinase